MPVYTSGRTVTRNYTGSRIRHLSGYVRPSETAFDLLDVSGILLSTESDLTVIGNINSVPAAVPFFTSISANGAKGGRINFSYTKLFSAGDSAMPEGSAGATSIKEYCADGEWSGNVSISYEGPACDQIRITGATGSITTTTHSGASVAPTNLFESFISGASWLSVDEAESGTEYDPVEGESTFVRKDIFDADATNLPSAWFDI